MIAETRELRLFFEELCCNLVRFHHVSQGVLHPDDVRINREVDLGIPGAFADIRVKIPNEKPYFIEVKYGYPREQILAHLSRKYGPDSTQAGEASKVTVMVESGSAAVISGLQQQLAGLLHPALAVEIWTEDHVLALVRERFAVRIDSFRAQDVLEIRQAIDRAKGQYAFGDAFSNDTLQSALLWHFGFWRLQQLRTIHGLAPREILPPGLYRGAVVLFADLSSFSSYVRDTRDDALVRHVLTNFYSKTRHEVLDHDGMMYQFLGDGVIALFGIPEARDDSGVAALECARAIIDIGNSVTHEWQRCIDHVQSSGGAHIGLALGDLNVLPMRPFSRAHMAVIGESVNLAARLTNVAGSGEIVISNALYSTFPVASRSGFSSLEPIEARNMGLIRAWKLPK